MKTPKRLEPLIHDGLIDEVVRPLMSGKEAAVYVVRSGTEWLCAKVYKEAERRGFKHSVLYQEGRSTRNSRRARAMERGTRYGRQEQEAAWQNAEVTALYRLAAAGVRVPQPHIFAEGVLLMELVTDAEGNPAPRLNDMTFTADEARLHFQFLLHQIVLMLCEGMVHGDLSEYNVLFSADGPVIIDLPQAIEAAGNNNARMMLERDVHNMQIYFGHFASELVTAGYGQEIWGLYKRGELTPDTPLSGQVAASGKAANVREVLREIEGARKENEARLRLEAERKQR